MMETTYQATDAQKNAAWNVVTPVQTQEKNKTSYGRYRDSEQQQKETGVLQPVGTVFWWKELKSVTTEMLKTGMVAAPCA